MKTALPPPALQSGTRVTHYALLGRDVGFSGRGRLFRGDTLLGRVPRMAIVEHQNGQWWLAHCGRTWNVRTATNHVSVADALDAAERRYPGSATRWMRTGYTKAHAEAYLNRLWKGETCSFCGRRFDQIQQMFPAPKNAARICNLCVDRCSAYVATYRAEQKAVEDRLLSPVCWDKVVRLTLRSRFLVLLDPRTLDLQREALQAMSARTEGERRSALKALKSSLRIGVRGTAGFRPGFYRVGPGDLEPARGRARDVADVDSGALILTDWDALPALATLLTRKRYDALLGARDGPTALRLWKAFGGPRFAILRGNARRPLAGAYRLRSDAPTLINPHD